MRKGSFGYRSRGRSFELVAGSLLVGHPGEEYICTHDHAFGDECLSFYLAPELVETLGGRRAGAPPLPPRLPSREVVFLHAYPWTSARFAGRGTAASSGYALEGRFFASFLGDRFLTERRGINEDTA